MGREDPESFIKRHSYKERMEMAPHRWLLDIDGNFAATVRRDFFEGHGKEAALSSSLVLSSSSEDLLGWLDFRYLTTDSYSKCLHGSSYAKSGKCLKSLALDQNLDGARLRARRRCLKGFDGVFEAESVGNQVLHVDDAVLDQSDGSGPGIGIAVLELEVDLLRAETHEGDLHVGFPDADDEDFAAEFDGVDLPRSVSLRS